MWGRIYLAREAANSIRDMKRHLIILMLFCAISLRAELVSLRFSVADYDGHPIQGAKISLETTKKRSLPYARTEYKEFSCTTDKQGLADERFFCWDGRVLCSVKAAGYYDEDLPDVVYRTNYDVRKKETVFLEDRKTLAITLFPRLNPIPMYSYIGNVTWRNFGTNQVEKLGYDLKKGDWVAPVGSGEVADFYLSHRASLTECILDSAGVIEFPEGAGGYVVCSDRADGRMIVYSADTNACYRTSFQAGRIKKFDGEVISQAQVLKGSECLVMRTRVKKNSMGEIVSCNYSKIYGPFEIAGLFRFKQSSFNDIPMENNLEFDASRNLGVRRLGRFQP